MSLFEPGHLHASNTGSIPGAPLFDIHVHYEVRHEPREGQLVHFRLDGEIAGRAFTEAFDMHRDTAFNFASLLSKAVHKHGFPTNQSLVMRRHDIYDAMFKDIREKLGIQAGEPVNFDHLDKDGL